MLNSEPTRLNKFISESGLCSRRQADAFIESGVVTINGKKAMIGAKVNPGDLVKVNGQKIKIKEIEEAVYLAFNKPVGVTCTSEESTHGNIVDYIGFKKRIFPIGRLDKDSQGLIFLTSDGDIVNKILRAGNKHEKEYLVTVNKPITDDFIAAMSKGVPILGDTTKKCFVAKESILVFRIILVQGLNRQIRRMCEYFNYEVFKLERTRIMNIGLKGLPVGEWRELTQKELDGINEMLKNSTSTEEGSRSIHSQKKSSDATSKKLVLKPNSNPDNRKRSHNPYAKKTSFKKAGAAPRKSGKQGKNSTGRTDRRRR